MTAQLEAMPASHTLPSSANELATICRRYRVRQLALFGSRARGDAQPDSDIDLLVEFQPEATPTLLDLAALEGELSQGMGGMRVDLRTSAELSRYFRDQVVLDQHILWTTAQQSLPELRRVVKVALDKASES